MSTHYFFRTELVILGPFSSIEILVTCMKFNRKKKKQKKQENHKHFQLRFGITFKSVDQLRGEKCPC